MTPTRARLYSGQGGVFGLANSIPISKLVTGHA